MVSIYSIKLQIYLVLEGGGKRALHAYFEHKQYLLPPFMLYILENAPISNILEKFTFHGGGNIYKRLLNTITYETRLKF